MASNPFEKKEEEEKKPLPRRKIQKKVKTEEELEKER